jgi:peroxiredoxin
MLCHAQEAERTDRDYWRAERLPFVGLADPEHTVARLYRQEVNLLRLGRMPAQLLADRQGRIRYQHYGHSMADIAINAEVLALLDQLNREGRPEIPQEEA